ncbi:MAG TPA: hypothetical protein PLU68_07030 [Thermotogota bacterium]|jgi:hypothetical protein|nr:hypothetical protein [Thermotogota bacterium]
MEQRMPLNPIHIIAAMVAVMLEVLILALFIYIIRSAPYEIEREPPMRINLTAATVQKEEIPEKPQPPIPSVTPKQPEPEKPIETTPEPVKEVEVDPLLEQLLAFEPKALSTPQKATTYLPQTRDTPAPMAPQAGLFDVQDIPLPPSQSLAPPKRYQSVYRENEYRAVRFEELKEYAFPNYEEVAAALKKDYNDLLKKQGSRASLLEGNVVVNMRFEKTGFPTVDTVSSPSPELANIVLRNMKLLRSGQNTEEMTFQVSLSFQIK